MHGWRSFLAPQWRRHACVQNSLSTRTGHNLMSQWVHRLGGDNGEEPPEDRAAEYLKHT